MADTKISAMTAAAALDGTEIVPIVQGGANVRTTTQDIADLAAGGTDRSLIVRIDPANVTKDGSNNISATADEGDIGLIFRQASATLQPLYVAAPTNWNNQPVIRYDGTNDYLRADVGAALCPAFTLAVVLAPKNTTTSGLVSWDNTLGANASPYMFFQRNSTDVKVYCDGNFRWTIAHTTNTPRLYVLTFDGGRYSLAVDGVAQADYDSTGLPANITAATSFMFGVGFNAYGNVDIGDVYLYNRKISSADQASLTTALKTKYGIA